MLDTNLLKSHLVKIIGIVEENYHIISQREFARGMLDGASGSFIINNDIPSIPIYSGIASTILAQRGLINPENKMHLQLALGELIINAIEHGNCGITYEEKKEGLANGISALDMVTERCKDPEVNKKKVEFLWDIQSDKTSFVISDEGKGFDVKSYLKKFAKHDKMSQHGLGIKMASMLATKLLYNKKGNVVTLILKHDDSVEHEVPTGFSQEQIHYFKAGDTVLHENEPSDYLYYIISGSYSVYHKSKKVGALSPQDIFMGEIAFLLNQPRSATIKADKPGKLVPISRKALVDIIRKHPNYCLFLSRLLAQRGLINPENKMHLQLALGELIINAI
jgi:two-component sensor histidine kinase